MVVLHGISRNAGTLARLFAPEAERTGAITDILYFKPVRSSAKRKTKAKGKKTGKKR